MTTGTDDPRAGAGTGPRRPVRTRRRPLQVYRVGNEPDPRFTFANERTFLAWIRTSLALFVTAAAIDALVVSAEPALRRSIAIGAVVLGIVCALTAFPRWAAAERALRLGRPLPRARLAGALALAVALLGVLIALAVS
ncbi:DUF202 domain-containing protein [Geodermatophilus sp. DF01-2]|uniref:YidH family protein n=1 Tax=Geodermatophilus sp. DF01-2 TaxID=2559610 RepID=UPI001073F796|nr:DUF202 domain-containing protein [Geodermatophilus sp. DF01_2]TFV53963.1 DUF202 domain-containing protein [Geodermatophilus sp. DF01_2]